MKDYKCKKQECRCLRYRESEAERNICLSCEHNIGFHEIPTVDLNEHPYGRCNELNCDCQRYKEGTLYNKCTYCSHSEGFHHRWENPIASAETSSSVTTQRRSRNAGRPRAERITIKYLICLIKVSSNKIPKEGTKLWIDLKNDNLIKENVEISQATPEELYNKLFDLFSEKLKGQGWILYRVCSGQPIKVNDELNFDLIKSNITKANKKLYIGPSERDIVLNLLSQDNLHNSSNMETTLQSPEVNVGHVTRDISSANNNSFYRSVSNLPDILGPSSNNNISDDTGYLLPQPSSNFSYDVNSFYNSDIGCTLNIANNNLPDDAGSFYNFVPQPSTDGYDMNSSLIGSSANLILNSVDVGSSSPMRYRIFYQQ